MRIQTIERLGLQVDERKFVKREGTSLVLDGRPFFFAGFNNYYMMTRSADSGTRKEVRNDLQSICQDNRTHRRHDWVLRGTSRSV